MARSFYVLGDRAFDLVSGVEYLRLCRRSGLLYGAVCI